MQIESVLRTLCHCRNYAGFFDWPDKKVKERGVLGAFVEAMAATEESSSFVSINSPPSDPPDCIATDTQGARVAVEITELIDQNMAREGQRVIGRYRDWTAPEVISRVEAIIGSKDLKCSGITGFTKVLLLIRTDEFLLQGYPGDKIRHALRAYRFRRPQHIGEVVVCSPTTRSSVVIPM